MSIEQICIVSTHATRTGRDQEPTEGIALSQRVSTHATRTGRDDEAQRYAAAHIVSTHATRTGRDYAKRATTV